MSYDQKGVNNCHIACLVQKSLTYPHFFRVLLRMPCKLAAHLLPFSISFIPFLVTFSWYFCNYVVYILHFSRSMIDLFKKLFRINITNVTFGMFSTFPRASSDQTIVCLATFALFFLFKWEGLARWSLGAVVMVGSLDLDHNLEVFLIRF